MWVVNRLGNVVVTAGHERPAGPFWDIAHTEVSPMRSTFVVLRVENSRPCLQYKFDEHSDLRKSNEPSPRAREPRKGLGDVPGQVAGWLDWKDRNRQGQTHQSRYYVVLQRDSKSLALFEREPPRNAPPGRPMAEVSLVPAPARTRLPPIPCLRNERSN